MTEPGEPRPLVPVEERRGRSGTAFVVVCGLLAAVLVVVLVITTLRTEPSNPRFDDAPATTRAR